MDASIQLQLASLLSTLYGALDERDYRQVAECFHADAVWTRQGKVLRGRTDILGALNERSLSMVVHHLFGNCLFEQVQDDRVTGRYLLTVWMADAGKQPQPLTAGTPQCGFCDVEFRRIDDRWLLHRMQARQPTFKATA